jgi:uncharacterized protein (TIGR00730 family)
MTEISAICVLCGSKSGEDRAFQDAAIRLGIEMARQGRRLIYGGGSIGLMGVLADTMLASGGEVTGVIPDFLVRHEVGHRRLTDLVITGSMHDRKRRMFELADGFVVLPGGLGTLDETFEILTWKQLRLHQRPIVVLDVNGYWRPLLHLLRSTVDQGFAHPAIADLFSVVTDPADVLGALDRAPTVAAEVLTSHL